MKNEKENQKKNDKKNPKKNSHRGGIDVLHNPEINEPSNVVRLTDKLGRLGGAI